MPVIVYVCNGSSCKKHKRKNKAIREALEGDAVIESVGCQKICKGPVVGLVVDGTLQWFRKVNAKGNLEALRKVVRGKRLPKSLAQKRVKKRKGKLR